jgi:autotransporter-associated beta strand protein
MAAPALAADLYWDGGDGTWNLNSNWSEDAANDTPDPANVPGQNDTAHFNRSGNNAVPQTINLGAVQSALGLVFSNTDTTNLNGLPANHGLNLYTGGITVNSGAGAVTLGSLTANEEMAFVLVGDQTWTNNSSNPITIVNQVGLFSGTQLTLDGSSTALNTIQGNMPFGGLMNVVKNGTGTWVLSGNNTLGATFINEGTLIANNSGGLSLSGVIVGDGAGAAASAVLEFGDDNQLPANTQHTVNADGQVNLNGNSQVFGGGAPNGFQLNNSSIVNSGTGVITMGANTALNGATGDNTVSGGTIDLGNAERSLVSGGATMTISSILTNGSVAKSGGTLTLTGNNDYAGGTRLLINSGTLNINSSTAIGTGTLTIENTGQNTTFLDNTSGAPVVLTTDNLVSIGTNFNFTGTNDLDLGNGAVSVANAATHIWIMGGDKTLALGGDLTFSTVGNALSKRGTGTLELRGDSNMTGVMTIFQGTLSVPSVALAGTAQPLGAGTGAVVMGSSSGTGTLMFTGGNDDTDRNFTIANNAAAGAIYDVTTGAATLTLAGNIAGGNATAPLTKTGAGTLKLTGSNNYAGPTNVNQGTLLISGTNSGSGLVTVGDGIGIDTLGGIGTIGSSISVAANGVLSPGESIGTLTVNNSGDVTLIGTLLIEVAGAGAGSSDLLSGVDVLTITGGTVDFSVLSALDDPAYVFASYGSLVGPTFGTVLNLPAGYQIDYNYLGGNQLALVVPEPTSAALMASAAIGFFALKRRRKQRIR